MNGPGVTAGPPANYTSRGSNVPNVAKSAFTYAVFAATPVPPAAVASGFFNSPRTVNQPNHHAVAGVALEILRTCFIVSLSFRETLPLHSAMGFDFSNWL